jgi:hypothetical protein
MLTVHHLSGVSPILGDYWLLAIAIIVDAYLNQRHLLHFSEHQIQIDCALIGIANGDKSLPHD